MLPPGLECSAGDILEILLALYSDKIRLMFSYLMIHDQKSLEENAFNLRSSPKISHMLKLSPLNSWSILHVFAC